MNVRQPVSAVDAQRMLDGAAHEAWRFDVSPAPFEVEKGLLVRLPGRSFASEDVKLVLRAADLAYTVVLLEAERDNLRMFLNLLSFDSPFPVIDTLRTLAEAAEHLHRVHDCDQHGYATALAAADNARALLARLSAYSNKP